MSRVNRMHICKGGGPSHRACGIGLGSRAPSAADEKTRLCGRPPLPVAFGDFLDACSATTPLSPTHRTRHRRRPGTAREAFVNRELSPTTIHVRCRCSGCAWPRCTPSRHSCSPCPSGHQPGSSARTRLAGSHHARQSILSTCARRMTCCASPQIPVPRVCGGYYKDQCLSCPHIIWSKVNERGRLCGACNLSSVLTTRCGICGEHGSKLGVPHCHLGYCTDCFGKWICVQIDEGAIDLRCPQPECTARISERVVKYLVGRGLVSREHVRRLQEQRNHGRLEFLKFVLRGADPTLTQWARTNTQACPWCFALVQKDKGCTCCLGARHNHKAKARGKSCTHQVLAACASGHHITCTCKGEFCYVCGVPYPLPRGHGNHKASDPPRLNPQGLDEWVTCMPCEDQAMPEAPGGQPLATTSSVTTDRVPPRTLDEARARIAAVLTLQCPHCERAVCMDENYDQCFALRCASCPTNFCAWCFRPAAQGEDPHTHVLDCPFAPEDMRGSALYLQDHNGGPHVPPNPHFKFVTHWREVHRRRALQVIESADDGAFDKQALVQEMESMMLHS